MKNTDLYLSGKSIDLKLVEERDAQFILSLRTDQNKNKFLNRVDNDLNKQVDWLKQYKTRESAGYEYYFIIIGKDQSKYGTVRLYDFIGDSFCWGSWIVKAGSPAVVAIESALLVYDFAFYELGFSKSHFDVRKENARVRAFHERMGAVKVNEDSVDCFYVYTKESYELIRQRYAKYL